MLTIVLLYFHQEKGPLVFYTFPEGELDNQLSTRLTNLLDQQNSGGLFILTFDNSKSINYYFEIHSDWSRRKKEMLMVSIILDQPISSIIEEDLSILCKEFSEQFRSNKKIFTAFYKNKRSNYYLATKIKTELVNNTELIQRNNVLIRKWVNNLYFSVVEHLF
jgi:hypothetical protein